MKFTFRLGDREASVELDAGGSQDGGIAGAAPARIDGRERTVETLRRGSSGELVFALDGRVVRAVVVRADDEWHVHVEGAGAFRLEGADRRRVRRGRAAESAGVLGATMTSQVVDVLVAPGDRVRKGDPLIVLEAMKMESRIVAPDDARVSAVHCRPGDVVEAGVNLVDLDGDAQDGS